MFGVSYLEQIMSMQLAQKNNAERNKRYGRQSVEAKEGLSKGLVVNYFFPVLCQGRCWYSTELYRLGLLKDDKDETDSESLGWLDLRMSSGGPGRPYFFSPRVVATGEGFAPQVGQGLFFCARHGRECGPAANARLHGRKCRPGTTR